MAHVTKFNFVARLLWNVYNIVLTILIPGIIILLLMFQAIPNNINVIVNNSKENLFTIINQ